MKKLIVFYALGIALVLPAQTIYANPLTFTANLIGALEVPPTGSPGTGFAEVDLNTVAETMHVHVTFSGLLGTTTASHIHCCLAFPGETGANVMVATTTPTFPGFPLGVTSGTYDQTFDLTLASSYNPAFVTAEGGLAQAEAALLAGIEARETYLNIHTNVFPGGEIRGILTPEPATLLLLVCGLAGLIGVRGKRRPRG